MPSTSMVLYLGYECMYVDVVGFGLVMWRGWDAHPQDARRRRRWWRSCRRYRGTECTVWPLIGSKSGKNSRKLDTVDKSGCVPQWPASSQKRARCQTNQSQGSWRVLLLGLSVSVFGPNWTTHTCFWLKPLYCCLTPRMPFNFFQLHHVFPPEYLSLIHI